MPTNRLVPVEHDAFGVPRLLLDVGPELVVHLENMLSHFAYVLDRLLVAGLDATGGDVLGDVAVNVANESRERWAAFRTRRRMADMSTNNEHGLRWVQEKW